MEMEYKDPSRRGRWIVVIGVLLAVVAGGAAFFLINQAQQEAGQAGLQKVAVVVAAQTIPARKIIEATDVTVQSGSMLIKAKANTLANAHVDGAAAVVSGHKKN